MQGWSDDAFAGYLAAMIDGEGHIERIGTWSVRIRIDQLVGYDPGTKPWDQSLIQRPEGV